MYKSKVIGWISLIVICFNATMRLISNGVTKLINKLIHPPLKVKIIIIYTKPIKTMHESIG